MDNKSFDKETVVEATRLPLVYSTCKNYAVLEHGFFTSWFRFFPEYTGSVYSTVSKDVVSNARLMDAICGKYDSRSFSSRLLLALRGVSEPYVLFALDDFWLNNKVNIALIEEALLCIQKDRSIAFVNLNEDGPGPAYASSSFVFAEKQEQYRICTQIGLWRVSCLRKLLRAGESAWAFENYGTERSRFSRWTYLRLSPSVSPAFSYAVGGILQRGVIRRSPAVLKQIDDLGLWDELEDFNHEPKTVKKPNIVARTARWAYRLFYRSISPFVRIPYLLNC